MTSCTGSSRHFFPGKKKKKTFLTKNRPVSQPKPGAGCAISPDRRTDGQTNRKFCFRNAVLFSTLFFCFKAPSLCIIPGIYVPAQPVGFSILGIALVGNITNDVKTGILNSGQKWYSIRIIFCNRFRPKVVLRLGSFFAVDSGQRWFSTRIMVAVVKTHLRQGNETSGSFA